MSAFLLDLLFVDYCGNVLQTVENCKSGLVAKCSKFRPTNTVC